MFALLTLKNYENLSDIAIAVSWKRLPNQINAKLISGADYHRQVKLYFYFCVDLAELIITTE